MLEGHEGLNDAGVPYEHVKEPLMRGRRTNVKEHTGQAKLPAIELEDGTWVREESKDLIRRIEAGSSAPSAASADATSQPGGRRRAAVATRPRARRW